MGKIFNNKLVLEPAKQVCNKQQVEYPSFFQFITQIPSKAFEYFFKAKPFGITKRSIHGVELTMGGVTQVSDKDGQLYVKASDEQCQEILNHLKESLKEPLKSPKQSHKSHISILSKSELEKLRKKTSIQAGKIVRFDEIRGLEKINEQWILKVRSNDLQSIRKQMGLKPLKNFHIVIATK